MELKVFKRDILCIIQITEISRLVIWERNKSQLFLYSTFIRYKWTSV